MWMCALLVMTLGMIGLTSLFRTSRDCFLSAYAACFNSPNPPLLDIGHHAGTVLQALTFHIPFFPLHEYFYSFFVSSHHEHSDRRRRRIQICRAQHRKLAKSWKGTQKENSLYPGLILRNEKNQ